MKPARIRYLVLFFSAMFLANNAMAAARACMLVPAAQRHAAICMLNSGCDEHSCPEADNAANRIAQCTQSYKSGEQKVSFDVPAFSIAAPVPPHRVWLPAEPGTLVISSLPPVGGPPLIILFGNLRI